MSSWIRHNSQKRVFKSSNAIIHNTNTNNVYNDKNTEKLCYQSYYFDYNKASSIINLIQQFSNNLLKDVKKIVNVYMPFYKNNVPAAGLGDFIRGCYFLYQYCKIANIDCDVNYNYHIINTILDNNYNEINPFYLNNIEHSDILNYHPNIGIKDDINLYVNIINNFNKYLARCHTDENGIMYVCIKPFPIFIISDDDRLFIKNSLKYNDTFKAELINVLESHKINEISYDCIHIRNGDKYLIKNSFDIPTNYVHKIESIIIKHITNYNKKYVLLGDNKIILNLINDRIKDKINTIIFDGNISHMGEGVNVSTDNIKNNMIEFYIMSQSSSILSISSYEHGSGFSKWCAETWNIPYTGIHVSV